MSENNTLHILFASRLVYEKWADILMESIDQYFSWAFPYQIIWHICSDWPYKDEILDRVKKFPSWVIYHGILDQAHLATLCRDVDFLFMPSRFLETFGLTALESLACNTPVIAFSKGWLIPFVPPEYSLDVESPVESFFAILSQWYTPSRKRRDLSQYSSAYWEKRLDHFFPHNTSVILLHDYSEKIGWAEYYVSHVEVSLWKSWHSVTRYGYTGKTTPWKRRWMFIFSLFAFWRGASVSNLLKRVHPEAIWMHSIQRYIGFWWVYAAMKYARNTGAKVYLSHHDVGLMAPFPQDVTEEADMPSNRSLCSFIGWVWFFRKILAMGKYFYIYLLRSNFPKHIEHIIFAPFLERHIHSHFPWDTISLFPHSFDEDIFYPQDESESHHHTAIVLSGL